ncbi:MAG: hypothetical protein Q8O40_00300 [Chloroflexota bacterium]|nr:hypothetical protein [Chloroflexota bacterium]
MPLWRFIALVFLAVAVIVVLAIWVFPATADFRPDNPFWNGLEDFRTKHKVTTLVSLAELPPDAQESVLVLIPYREPRTADVDQLKSFLKGGGTVVLADDYGFGNPILEALGAEFRFNRSPLLDPLFNYRDKWFPLATEISPSSLTAGVTSLAFDYATVLEGPGLTVVARSSPFSFLDLNVNGKSDTDEPTGPFPVAGYSSVAGGRLILVSDPSIFISSMTGANDNARFIANLLGAAGASPRALVDQSFLPPSTLTEAKGGLARVRVAAGRPTVLVVLTAALGVVLLYPAWRRSGGSRDSE